MSQPSPAEIARKTVLFRLPGMDDATVRRDVEYARSDGSALVLDLYLPAKEALPGVVVLVAGYPEAGFRTILGCASKEMGSSVSWARLIAASGLAAVTYTNRRPEADLHTLVDFLRGNAGALGVDASRMALWATSGNGPLAVSLLMKETREPLKCAALGYAYTLDPEGSDHVAQAARTWGFANPCAGRSIADVAADVPLFLARAGHDQTPHLNEALDRFAAGGLARNLPITLVNHPDAPHAFDLFDECETTREVIARVLSFLRFQLGASDAVESQPTARSSP